MSLLRDPPPPPERPSGQYVSPSDLQMWAVDAIDWFTKRQVETMTSIDSEFQQLSAGLGALKGAVADVKTAQNALITAIHNATSISPEDKAILDSAEADLASTTSELEGLAHSAAAAAIPASAPPPAPSTPTT